MKIIQKIAIGFVAAAFLSPSAAQAAEKVSKIRVAGLHCSLCAKGLESSLTSIEGVKSVRIDMAGQASGPKLVTITHDDEKITEAKLRELIRESGFKPVGGKKKSR